ncbi:hypothetical protein IMZ48_10995, partial [Candidatus Bathyarchaeota archaeon]|nr:hypothetical protein [Candidatus Bathyarchaeota archaeon]
DEPRQLPIAGPIGDYTLLPDTCEDIQASSDDERTSTHGPDIRDPHHHVPMGTSRLTLERTFTPENHLGDRFSANAGITGDTSTYAASNDRVRAPVPPGDISEEEEGPEISDDLMNFPHGVPAFVADQLDADLIIDTYTSPGGQPTPPYSSSAPLPAAEEDEDHAEDPGVFHRTASAMVADAQAANEIIDAYTPPGDQRPPPPPPLTRHTIAAINAAIDGTDLHLIPLSVMQLTRPSDAQNVGPRQHRIFQLCFALPGFRLKKASREVVPNQQGQETPYAVHVPYARHRLWVSLFATTHVHRDPNPCPQAVLATRLDRIFQVAWTSFDTSVPSIFCETYARRITRNLKHGDDAWRHLDDASDVQFVLREYGRGRWRYLVARDRAARCGDQSWPLYPARVGSDGVARPANIYLFLQQAVDRWLTLAQPYEDDEEGNPREITRLDLGLPALAAPWSPPSAPVQEEPWVFGGLAPAGTNATGGRPAYMLEAEWFSHHDPSSSLILWGLLLLFFFVAFRVMFG